MIPLLAVPVPPGGLAVPALRALPTPPMPRLFSDSLPAPDGGGGSNHPLGVGPPLVDRIGPFSNHGPVRAGVPN